MIENEYNEDDIKNIEDSILIIQDEIESCKDEIEYLNDCILKATKLKKAFGIIGDDEEVFMYDLSIKKYYTEINNNNVCLQKNKEVLVKLGMELLK